MELRELMKRNKHNRVGQTVMGDRDWEDEENELLTAVTAYKAANGVQYISTITDLFWIMKKLGYRKVITPPAPSLSFGPVSWSWCVSAGLPLDDLKPLILEAIEPQPTKAHHKNKRRAP